MSNEEFKINPPVCQKRVPDSAQINKTIATIRKEWTHCPSVSNYCCGNVRARVDAKGKVTLDAEYGDEGVAEIYEYLSSPLALYRSLSTLECGTDFADRQDFYKMNWSITLRHNKTGQFLVLGEWKGGFQIFTSSHSPSKLPKAFKVSTIRLLQALINPTLPINYDGTVAGSIA